MTQPVRPLLAPPQDKAAGPDIGIAMQGDGERTDRIFRLSDTDGHHTDPRFDGRRETFLPTSAVVGW